MKKTGKQWMRKGVAFLLAMLVVLTGLPMEGITAYAAGTPDVSMVSVVTRITDQGTSNKLTITGSNLKKATVLFNGTPINSSIPGVVIDDNSEIYFTATFPSVADMKIKPTNSLQIGNSVGSQAFTVKFGTAIFPTLTAPDKKIYNGTDITISGTNIKSKTDYGADSAIFYIGGMPNGLVPPYTPASDGRSAEIKNVQGRPGKNQNISIEVTYPPTPNTINGVTKNIDSSYEFELEKVVDIKTPIIKYPLRIVPDKGPATGGTTLNIQARRPNGTIVEDEDLFKDSMKVTLIKRDNPWKGKEIETTNLEVVRNTAGQGIGLVVDTGELPKLSGGVTDLNYLGFYHLILSSTSNENEESMEKDAFEYFEGGNPLFLDYPKPDKGPDTGGTKVTVVGKNIFSLEGVPGLEGAATVTIPNSVGPDPDPTKKDWLYVKYTFAPGTVKYGGKDVSEIIRRIRVTIGRICIPEALPFQGTRPVNWGDAHYAQKTPSEEGAVFTTTRINVDKPDGLYDVNMETRTSIKLQGEANFQQDVVERKTARQKFEYERTSVNPTVNTVEPVYGYYNNRGALGLDPLPQINPGDPVLPVDSDSVKPIMIRLKGTNFQVERELDTVTGAYIKKYPIVEIRDNEATGLPFPEISAKAIKVLKQDGTEVDGQKGNQFGDIMVVEISPTPDNAIFGTKVLLQGATGNGYKGLKSKIYVEQQAGSNDGTISREPVFEFRYPTVNENLKQPFIENVYMNGSPLRVFNADAENEITVRMKADSLLDMNSVMVTIDGMDMKSRIISRTIDPDDPTFTLINLKTPKNIRGETRLQVIVNEGLMDSYNMEFQPVTGPWLKELIPNNGQAGTWIIIKRDEKANNIVFKPGDPHTGTVVRLGDKEILADYEVKDPNTILFKIPDNESLGSKNIQVENPDKSRSQGLPFLVRDIHGDKVEILSIDPNRGNVAGGIPTTITAKSGTNFAGGVDIYFASQKATIIGTNIDFTKVFVKVPKFVEKNLKSGESYTVPVTIQKKESGATGTVKDGFTYFNPTDADKLKITDIYKKDVTPKTNKGNAGDQFWVEGTNFIATTTGSPLQIVYPDIYFGYEKAEILEQYKPEDIGTEKRLPRILVQVPKPTAGIQSQDGAVDVMLINPNGATTIKSKGFIYGTGTPQILSKDLEASRFDGQIKVEAKEVYQKDLIVAFGKKITTMDLGHLESMVTVLDDETEKIVIKYLPGANPNFEIYYRNPDGSLLLMSDATDGGKVHIPDLGVKKIVKINWKNPAYHKSTKMAENKDLLARLNDEYMSLEIVRDGRVNKLEVRRGLGKVEKFSLNPNDNVSTMLISTPYNHKIEKTTITLINADGSSASAPFTFNDGLGGLEITDIEGSKEREVPIGGTPVKAKVKTQDVTVDGVIKILGKNFKDITSVKIGGKEMKIENISPDYTYMIVSVPKGDPNEAGKPLSVDITSKIGNDFSDKKTPPIYFMYVVAGSKPVIDTMVPDKGPRTGGTSVRITGKGFREKDEFGIQDRITVTVNGSAPAAVNKVEKNDKEEITGLQITMPASVAGKAKLQVINADGGTSDPKDFGYISQPKITKMGDAVFFNDTDSTVKIIGEDFQTGAKVIIGGTLQKGGKKPADAKHTGMLGVVGGINQDAFVTGGQEAADVKVETSGTLTFKMPSGIEQVENLSVIILNPDGGISDPGEGAVKPPVPDVPIITATPGFERSVILRWKVAQDVLNKAEKFEVYAKLSSDSTYTFVGDTMQQTSDQSYMVKGLEYNQSYDFKVRVMNKYGEAVDLGYVRGFTLTQGEDYKEKEKQEQVDKAVDQIRTQGKQEVVGDLFRYTLGTGDTFVNLTPQAKYKDKQVQISVRDIEKDRNKKLTIIDGNLSLNLTYGSLLTPEVARASSDSLVRISLSSIDKKKEDQLRSAVKRNQTRLSSIYGINFELVEPKRTQKISMLSGNIGINIVSTQGFGYHAIYQESEDQFQRLPVTGLSKGGYYVLLRDKN